MDGAADWSRTCEECAYVVDEEGPKGGLWARCFAPGEYKGRVVGIGRFFPYVPAWCPLMKKEDGETMNEWYEQAAKKLSEEKVSGKYDRYAGAMKDAVCEALDGFCKQDGEFAQAVFQGGTFENCMKEVAKGCGSAISDLEAFRRAVRFYFPGADVRFHMTVDLCASVEDEEPAAEPEQPPKAQRKILNLEDFL